MASEKQKFDFEFHHEGEDFYTVGTAWTWSEEVVGTTFGEEVEHFFKGGIDEIDFDFIGKITDEGYNDVTNEKEFKEIAIEAVTNKLF